MRKKKLFCVLALALTLPVLASCGKEPQDAYWKDSDRPAVIPASDLPDAENEAESGYPAAIPTSDLPDTGNETGQIVQTNASGHSEEPVSPPSAPSPVLPGEEPVKGSGRDAMLKVYTDILNGFYYDHVDHTGQDMGYAGELDESGNQFAIYDVDQDGQDELLVYYTRTIASAGVREYVLGYDAESGTVREEISTNPRLIYYDNGVIEALWYYNRGRAGDVLWPYTFWRYDPKADAYRPTEMADAWDKSLVEEGFPDSADKDGDGVVYYLIEYGDYVDYSSDTPVDKSGYDTWRESFTGGATVLSVPYVTLNESNINSIR